jgi:hypothetical protein
MATTNLHPNSTTLTDVTEKGWYNLCLVILAPQAGQQVEWRHSAERSILSAAMVTRPQKDQCASSRSSLDRNGRGVATTKQVLVLCLHLATWSVQDPHHKLA